MQDTAVKYSDNYAAAYAGHIPTPPKRDFALFKLVQGSTIQKRFSENGAVENVECFPGITNLPLNDMIIDKDDNPVYIHYHQGLSTRGNPDGSQVQVYNYPAIIFEKGQLKVNVKTQRKLYEYMMVCNFNVSNTHRDPSKMGLFQYIDEESIQEKSVAEYRDKMEFQTKVWALDGEVLNVVADNFNYNVQGSTDYIKQYILQSIDDMADRSGRVRKREEILAFLASIELKKWAQLFRMKKHERILFDNTKRVWKYTTGTEDEILTVPSHVDNPEAYLVEFLSDQRNRTAATAWGNVLKGIKSKS